MANEFVARNGIIALDNSAITGSLNVSGGITGSLFGTASFSNTASFVNPLRQDVIITGSLSVSGSILLNGTGSIIGSGSTNYLSKFTGTTALGNSQIFDNGTSVGINTASPASTLELYKASGTNYLYITNAAATTNNGVVLRYLGVDYMGMIGNFFTGELKIGGFNASSFFPTFYSNNAERMRLTPSGRLLLGTATESTFLLDVNGTSRFTNNMVVTGSITANGAAIVYSVQKNQADQSNPLQFYVAYNHINPRIEFWGGQGARLHYNTSTRVLSPDTASGVDLGTSALNFGNVFSNTITTNTSSFFATVSGSVGIGKTSANAILDVNGSTIISGSLTVFTGSAVEFQVTNTGVRIGNVITDTHTVTGSLNVSGSITTTGTITAQTLVVQTITSSTDFVTGSTRFGSLSSNTHQFTGSVSITGSLTATSNVLVTGSLLISTGSLSDFLRTSNAGVTNFRISSSGYPVWGVPGFDVISVPGATWTPIVTWDGANVQWGDTRANRSIMTPGIGGGYVTVPNITFINSTYTTQVNNLFGNSFIVNNNNVTSTLGTVNMVIQATGSQTGNMLQFKNGAGSVLSGVDASGSLFINKTTANARLDVNGPTIISGSLTVFTGSAVELQVTNTGVRIGNVTTDVHTVTGSFNVSGSVTAIGNTTISGSTVITGSFTVITGSAVEFQVTNTGVRMGNIATDTHTVTGSMYQSGSTVALSLRGSGSGVFTVDGTAGRLFSVDDSLSGSLFSVNTAAGLPIIEAFSDNTVRIGQYGQRVLFVSQSRVGIGKETGLNANLDISGSAIISGSFTVFTGSAVELQVTNTGVRIGNASTDTHTVTGSFNISGSGFVQGGGLIVSGTLATSGSGSQGLVAPLKFTTAPVNTNYTLVYTDEGKMVEMNYNVDAPLTVTIPLNSSVPFPIGTEISIIQIGAGTTVITGSSGVTVNSYLGFKTIDAQYGVASVVKRGTDSWYLFGNLS